MRCLTSIRDRRWLALMASVAGVALTEAQVATLERKRDDEEASGEIETAHPGYLGRPEQPQCSALSRC